VANNQITEQVFIGGCSRSGTTLLGSMLGAHHACICSPESHFKVAILRKMVSDYHHINLKEVMSFTTKHWRFQIWDLPLALENIEAEASGNGYGDMLNWLVSQYAQHEDRNEARIWVDHTPENISYATTLTELFPNSKFIHLVRDGRAVAASIMPLDWGPNSIIKSARWWMRMVSFGLAAESCLPSNRIMRVKYESLVADPESTLQSICQFLKIPYEPAMKDAKGFRPPRYTIRQHRFVGSKPNRQATNRWKTTLSPREIEIFEHQTRNFLTYLEYPMEYGVKAIGPSWGEVQRGKQKELIQGEFINKVKWLIRSYPLWLQKDFFKFAKLTDTNN
jgi:hypothetical protein